MHSHHETACGFDGGDIQDAFSVSGLEGADRAAKARRRRLGWAAAVGLILSSFVAPAIVSAQSGSTGSAVRTREAVGPTLPQPDARAAGVRSWLYAVDDGRQDGSGTLYRLGTTPSGGFVGLEVIGETGIQDIWDIGFMGNRLFGVGPGTSFGTSESVIVEIDPKTGVATGVGTIDPGGDFNALVGETSSTLLAATTTGNVWRLNPDALTATQLGSFGSGLESTGDFARASNGTVFATVTGSSSDWLARVNLSNGRATLVGRLDLDESYGLTIDPASGALLAVVRAEDSPRLVSVNSRTGAMTVIGRVPVSQGLTGLAAAPTRSAGCPSGYFTDPSYPDFCFRARIQSGGETLAGHREPSCLADTVCVSGAVPGRAELFLRILGPRPNGYLWPTLIRFTPSRVVVDIHQKSTGRDRRYTLPAVLSGQPLSGEQDREGFRP